ncbi:MAG TPA: S41 family peptidase [Steroidobacteraceae bacterium]|nr:S41 family peptidase [Steroidobacteraceae bacterium]
MSRALSAGVLLVSLHALAASAPPPAAPCNVQQLTGEWRSVGYNNLLAITPQKVTQFNVTAISRIAVREMSPAQFAQRFDRLTCRGVDRIALFDRGGNTPYEFVRAPSRPAALRVDLPQMATVNDDPLANFAVFSQYFAENYAFMRAGEVDVDWSTLSAKIGASLRPTSSQAELLAALESAIRPLRDAHVRVTDAGDTRIASSLPLQEQYLLMGYIADSGIDPATVPRAAISTRFHEATRSHARSQARVQLREQLREQLVSGWLDRDLGYIAVHSFAGLASEDSTAEPDRAAMHAAMLNVLSDLRGARGIVIDLRFNGGGYDPVALEFVGFFTAQRRLAYTKQAWFEGRTVTDTPIYLAPATQAPYTGPLAVLVSDGTASGAEIALLALRELPRRTFVGQPSRGILSDTLPSKLPNGWSVTLSNEIYATPQGVVYERIRIPVDIAVPVLVEGSWRRGLDASVGAAVEALQREVSASSRPAEGLRQHAATQ